MGFINTSKNINELYRPSIAHYLNRLSEILIEWIKTKLAGITDYRNKQFNNFYTGNLSHKNKVNWFEDREP